MLLGLYNQICENWVIQSYGAFVHNRHRVIQSYSGYAVRLPISPNVYRVIQSYPLIEGLCRLYDRLSNGVVGVSAVQLELTPGELK